MSEYKSNLQLTQPLTKLAVCPHCQSAFQAFGKSLVCTANHSFDIAKQGYVNLLPKPANSQYSKSLFAARRSIITESGLYRPLHQLTAALIRQHAATSMDSLCLLDAGCGEGSHLQHIAQLCKYPDLTAVGLDIAKAGIAMAAGSYKHMAWLVGDLANLPLAAHSFDVVLNMLSPSNYSEFKRALRPNGLVIKVVPRQHYFQQLREALFPDSIRAPYSNERTVKLFQQHFTVQGMHRLTYTHKLGDGELEKLHAMSPLAWNAQPSRIAAFLEQDELELTVDVDVLVGQNKH